MDEKPKRNAEVSNALRLKHRSEREREGHVYAEGSRLLVKRPTNEDSLAQVRCGAGAEAEKGAC
jgi:hypothetical protein